MFATPTSYVVTPSRKPFMRIPERASTFLRDVKRRSTRKVKRSKSLVSNKEKLSGSFVQLNEDETRQKYIDDVAQSKAWRTSSESCDDILHSTLELPAAANSSCSCRLHSDILPPSTAASSTCQHSQLFTTPSGSRHRESIISSHRLPLPPSPCSTIYAPKNSGGRHNTSCLTTFTPRQSVRDLTIVTDQTPKPLKFDSPFSSPCSSSGLFRKLSSPTLADWTADDKENMLPPPTPSTPMLPPAIGTPLAPPNLFAANSSLLASSASISRRRNTLRRSSIFTPSFRKKAQVTAAEAEQTPGTCSYRKASLRTPSSSCIVVRTSSTHTPGISTLRTPVVQHESKKIKKLGGGSAAASNGNATTIEETGQGRIIPTKQGYLYKKSGSSRMYRRKYVTLCDDGTMTYYPSFQAYVDNIGGKEIHLQHVTVKVPGQKPTGLKSSTTTSTISAATPARISSASMATPSTKNAPENAANNGHSSSDEFDKDTTVSVPDKTAAVPAKTPKRKRHRLSDETVESQPPTSLFELVIVSLDSRMWHFQVCSQEEGEEWVSAIQHQIHSSLQAGNILHKDAANSGRKNGGAEFLRNLAGNDACADCGTAKPGWASLNLGTLICIECSGIHRNLGTHISKVRSLDLDSWSASHLELMKAIGNRLANSVWEEALQSSNLNTSSSSLQFWNKPGPESSREDKENFIKSKYLAKNFMGEERPHASGQLVRAMDSDDMKLFLCTLINLSCEELNSEPENPLKYAISNQKLVYAQLLAWKYSDSTEIKIETENGNLPTFADSANHNSATYIADAENNQSLRSGSMKKSANNNCQLLDTPSDQSPLRIAKQLNFDGEIVHESQLL